MSERTAVLYFTRPSPLAERVHELVASEGFRVLRSEEPTDALGHLMDEPVGVMLLDAAALTPSIERLFRQWRETHPLLEVVGIAGIDEKNGAALVRMDCRRIIRPPMDPDHLLDSLRGALAARTARAGLVHGDERVASRVLQATQALVTAVELKDAYTRGRADRVALFAGILADEAGGVDVDRIRAAARIMDVGKTGVPGDVLNKTERLTEEEYEQVQRHPLISWEMLRHLFLDDVVLNVARHHHERWDGQGYPDGLAGEAIPLEARIVAIADSLDAMTSTRAFRQARLWSEAVEDVVDGSGSRYDPRLVRVLEHAQDRMLVGA